MNDVERRSRRLRRAHLFIRAELAVALALPLLAGFVYVAAPAFPGGTFPSPRLIDTLVPLAGVSLFIVGLVWMIRLSRLDPEPGKRTWRYRAYE